MQRAVCFVAFDISASVIYAELNSLAENLGSFVMAAGRKPAADIKDLKVFKDPKDFKVLNVPKNKTLARASERGRVLFYGIFLIRSCTCR